MYLKKRVILSVSFCFLLVLSSCGNGTNKETNPSSEEPSNETPSKNTETNNGNLAQKGNYERLFSLDGQCKITVEEIATLYGIAVADIKENYSNATSDGGHSCSYNLTLKDGSLSLFALTVFKMPTIEVTSQIENWKTGSYEKQFLTMSSSGDHYVWKHPNQGHFTVYNPAYANGIRLQYMNLLKKDKTQKEYLEQKGLQAIDYLIEKYKD